MTERIPEPADFGEVGWRTNGASPNAATDPGASLRADGWPVDAVPGSDEFNFIQRVLGQSLEEWLALFVPREWATLAEGIGETAAISQLFRVFAPVAGILARGAQIFSVAGTATGNTDVKQPRTDGEQIYYFGGTSDGRIVAANPETGAELWEVGTPSNTSAIEVDGLNGYFVTNNAGNVGIRKFALSTGFIDGVSAGAEYAYTLLRSNGEFLIGIRPNSGVGVVGFYSNLGGLIAEDGTVDTTSAGLLGACVDAEWGYVGGAQSATKEIWCYKLSTRALVWDLHLPTVAPATVAALATDGDTLYAVTDQQTLTAGGTASLYAIDRLSGNILWTADPFGAAPLTAVVVDDRYLYVSDNTPTTLAYRLRDAGPTPPPAFGVAAFQPAACDGASVIGNGSSTLLERHTVGGATKTYMRAGGDDPNRRPFFNLAVPVDGRI